ncbi:FG-GAP-like repeat-containing protein [Streptomyces tricolor]|nr:FG-GAP-like repeat-containing protein [Streptomyces tricolor]
MIADFNKDGYGDLAAGSQMYNNYQGRVSLWYGSSTGPATSARITQATTNVAGTPESGDLFGSSVSAADINGDGCRTSRSASTERRSARRRPRAASTSCAAARAGSPAPTPVARPATPPASPAMSRGTTASASRSASATPTATARPTSTSAPSTARCASPARRPASPRPV